MHHTMEQVKRHAYIVATLIGLVGTVLDWVWGPPGPSGSAAMALFNTLKHPVVSITCIAIIWTLSQPKIQPPMVERLGLKVFSGFYLAWVVVVLYGGGETAPHGVTETGYWQLLALSVIGFLVYDYRKGVAHIVALYGITLGLHMAKVITMSAQDLALTQWLQVLTTHLYLATVIILICILGLTKEHWARIDREAKAMRKLADTDPLTEVSNRRRLNTALSDAIRHGRTPLTVIMFDIDSFKEINDRFGHIAGDQVLVTTAHIVQDVVRQADAFGRWGGEEFLVLCPRTDLTKGWQIAERLRLAIASHYYEGVGKITASFGVAQYRMGESPDELIGRVDNVLYLAKTRGKNRVEAALPKHPVA